MATECEHITDRAVNIPGPTENVYREDCTQCFASIDDADGLNVCLTCFNGGCPRHNPFHVAKKGHSVFLNIRRTKKHRDEPPPKLSKLAIAAESEEDRYDTQSYVFCTSCNTGPITTFNGKLKDSVAAVTKAPTFARQAEVKAWEQELIPCEHTLCLNQDQTRAIPSQGKTLIKNQDPFLLIASDLGQCSSCDLKENLWLCLTCGSLGCGRSQFGSGVKGNSHALAHGTESSHPVAVKLGSITPDGTADIYCYACNDERVDPELSSHLANFGINIADREKTEKSLTEMQIEQNLKWDFSMVTEDGKELRPIFGKGLTGLKNLGNSCYMSSTFQCLFSLPAFQNRYNQPSKDPPDTSAPAEDLETQLRKMADGLLSGTWSKPDSDVNAESEGVPYQKGLAPAMLKHLIGKGHAEFSTMRQQDAFEFLLHVFKLITRSSQTAQLSDPTKSFGFVLDERLQCSSCRKVRYRPVSTDNISIPVPVRRKSEQTTTNGGTAKPEFEPVTLKECLTQFTGTEHVDLTCTACGSKDGFYKRSLFKTFPETLAVNAQRFEIVNWVPTKLDIPVVVGDEAFTLDDYHSTGLRQDEELLPEDVEVTQKFVPNEATMGQLEAMGFPRVRCEKALHATGNADAEAAMNWLFSHMEDPDIDQSVELSAPDSAQGGGQVNQESIDMVVAMGIDPAKARKALKETDGDIERAVDWVFSHPDDPGDVEDAGPAAATETEVPGSDKLPASYRLKAIICHKGASIHAGHYVAFVRKTIEGEENQEEQWVLFNDEKVVHAVDVEEMKKFAYVYFFERL